MLAILTNCERITQQWLAGSPCSQVEEDRVAMLMDNVEELKHKVKELADAFEDRNRNQDAEDERRAGNAEGVGKGGAAVWPIWR